MKPYKISICILIILFCSTVASANIELQTYNIAVALGEIYKQKDWPIAKLQSNLQKLKSLDAQLKNAANDKNKLNALQYRTLAWIHGWAAFSRVVAQKQKVITQKERQHLFALKINANSVLQLLLQIYRQMFAYREYWLQSPLWKPVLAKLQSQDKFVLRHKIQAEPLFAGLARGNAILQFLCAYKRSWLVKPRWCLWPYFIPKHEEILGKYHDAPKLNNATQLLSLWAIVNMQLDQWHTQGRNGFDFAGLTTWLQQMADSKLITLFDNRWKIVDPAFLKRLQEIGIGKDSYFALQPRLQRLQCFLAFRQYISDKNNLQTMVEALANFRSCVKINKGKVPIARANLLKGIKEMQCRRAFYNIFTATEPFKKQTIYDAQIWLQYIILLSYERQGLATLLTDPLTNFENFSSKLMGVDTVSLQKPEVPSHGQFVRWHQYPSKQHYSIAMHEMMSITRGYLQLQKERLEGDDARFETQQIAAFHAKYCETLAKQKNKIAKIAKKLHPYVSPGVLMTNSSIDTYTPLHIDWSFSCTHDESERLRSDIAGLAGRIFPLHKQITTMHQTLQNQDISIGATVMQTLGASASLPAWDVHTYPDKSFHYYATQVEKAVAALRGNIAAQQTEEELRHAFKQKWQLYEQACRETKIAEMGMQIAEKAQQIAEEYYKIAKIERDICDIQQQISNLLIKEAQLNEKAKIKALEYATWLRDLAIARQQALESAIKIAHQQVVQAVADMEDYGQQIRGMADRIHDQNRKKRRYALIKGIVTIAGAVAAPFTGGASLAVANIATNVVNIVQTAETTNWRDFDQAVAGMVQITTLAQDAVSVGLNQFGDKASIKKFEQMRREITNATTLTEDSLMLGKKIYDGIKNEEKFFRIAACVATHFPSRYENGNLEFTFSNQKIAIKLPGQLQNAITEIVEAGGLFSQEFKESRATAQTIINVAGHLPQIQRAFLNILERELKQVPFALLERNLGPNRAEELRSQYRTACNNAFTAYQALPRDQQLAVKELLDHVRAKAMPIIKVGDKLIAIEKNIHKDLQEIRERTKKIQNLVSAKANQEIRRVVVRLQKIKSDVQTKVQQAGNNETALRNLARQVRDSYIPRMKTACQDLRLEIEQAQQEVEQCKTKVEIASYEADAATVRTRISRLMEQVADLRYRQAQKSLEAKREEIELANLGAEKSKMLQVYADAKMQACWQDVCFSYQKCIDFGFDPTAKNAIPKNKGLVRLLNSTSLRNGKKIDEGIKALFGMIRWLSLLKPQERELPNILKFYRELVNVAMAVDIANPRLVESWLTQLKDKLKKEYDRLVAVKPQFIWRVNQQFFAKNTPGENPFGKWRKEENDLVYEFACRLTTEPDAELPEHVIVEEQVDDDKYYYVRFANIHLRLVEKNLDGVGNKYLEVTPPVAPKANKRTLLGMHSAQQKAEDWKQAVFRYRRIVFNLNEIYQGENIGNLILGYINDDPQLIPAIGTWKFKIVFKNERNLTLEQLQKRNLRFQLYMGVLIIFANAN